MQHIPAPTGVNERERRVYDLAASQHGLATRQQLLNLGFSARTIAARIESGRYRAIHRGVYLLGPVAPPGAVELAAVLAYGGGTYASHHTAAALRRLPLPAQPASVHVTVVGRNARSRRGIAVHRVGSLEADERQILDGIPTTTPARTVLDLAAALDRDDLEHLLAEAQGRNRSTLDQLDTLIDRYPRRRGTRRLRSLLEQGDPARTRACSERRLLALIRRAGLPAPETNTILHGHEVDFLWRRERVVVEVDGHAWHASRPARERDALRDQELVMRGYLVLRVTWFQITRRPEALVARLAAVLAQRGGPVDQAAIPSRPRSGGRPLPS
jgi:very-short-patch-repair endonuclease